MKVQIEKGEIEVENFIFFDRNAWQWLNDANCNLGFIKSAIQYLNDVLRCRKYVLLNELLEYLGLNWTKAGTIVGWTCFGDSKNIIEYRTEIVNDDEIKIIFETLECVYDKI